MKAKFDRGEIDGDGNPTGFAGGGHPGGAGGFRWQSASGQSPFEGAQGDPFEGWIEFLPDLQGP